MTRPIGSFLALVLLLVASPALAQDGGTDGGTDGGMDLAVVADMTTVADAMVSVNDLSGEDLTAAVADGGSDAPMTATCDLSADGGATTCVPFQPPRSTGSCSVAGAAPERVSPLLGLLAGGLALALTLRRRRRRR